jgi:hypothetical protein
VDWKILLFGALKEKSRRSQRLQIISDFSYEKDTRWVLNGEPWHLDKSIIGDEKLSAVQLS